VRLLKPLGRRTLEKADKIIAVSEYEKNLLMEQFKLDFDKIAVIPAGVDFNDFKGLKRHERNFRSILYVGRLVEYKGVQYLVEVLPMLPNDVILEIVGKGPLRPYLEKRAKALGVFERVRFYQNLPRRELLQKYVDADVFVLLSRYEAYSITVAEALVAGTPCIVAKASALTEWIDNKICFGINLPINLKCLTGLIIKVLERAPPKPVTKNMFGNKIVEWDNVTEQLESIYLQ
jgi:glycosyltransferase involved in cell wall biosynthesis